MHSLTIWKLALSSLRFHARSHLGAFLGAAIGSAVLVGALVVGDSVRGSLKDVAMARLGKIELALSSGDRLFREALAGELQKKLGAEVTPVLMLRGTASIADGSGRANSIQVSGVDGRFWNLASSLPDFKEIPAESVVLNSHLAAHLKAKIGDVVLVRVPKPSTLSPDAPLAPSEDSSVALRLKVHAIADDSQLGRFGLQANQVAAFNAFVPLVTLQQKSSATNRANLLLLASAAGRPPTSIASANEALKTTFTLDDAQVELRSLPQFQQIELRSRRIFLDAPAVEAAAAANPAGQGLLTYFVNQISAGPKATPYSMVTATKDSSLIGNLKDDEVVINSWLATDLAAKPGDKIAIRYFVIGPLKKLDEVTNTFTVVRIVPLEGLASDRSLMPDFPGMANASNCRDWDAGFPINLDAIRPQDQKYWEDYRGTPKAFITLAAGQKLWANRFGNLTAIRFAAPATAESISSGIRSRLNPGSVGLSFQPVRVEALAASAQSQDFGGLFIGFSFFLILAALLLMALLFQFSIENRATEAGTLLAIGFTPRQVRRLFLIEGSGLAFIGGIAGMVGGVFYARAMLRALTTVWRDAIASATLTFHLEPATLVGGGLAAIIVSTVTIWLSVRKLGRQPARVLLAEGAAALDEPAPKSSASASRWARIRRRLLSSPVIALVSLAAAVGSVADALMKHDANNAESFFSAGMFLLIAGIAVSSFFLRRLNMANSASGLTLGGLGTRNASRRPKRSLGTIALLGSGAFLIASIGVFRLDAVQDADKRSSGTGGFALIGESSLPVVADLNSKSGRDALSLDGKAMENVSVVPFRVRDGDDASCLNLNRAQRPRLLGVQPGLLAGRKAFSFAEVAKGLQTTNPWALLVKPASDSDPIPAIGDQASILWALGKKIGDTLDYTDERGRTFKLLLVGAVANSILQGNLVINEDAFVNRFPGEAGYRWFLLDCPPNSRDAISKTLSRALRDLGLELTPAVERLAAFNAVQNTYLGTFQILGGLGLLLGSMGLGVVVLRNVLERRAELGVLAALGFPRTRVRWLVVSEHGTLLLAGLLLGVLSAVVSVIPAIGPARTDLPITSLALTLLAVFASGTLWTWLACVIALRGPLIQSIRSE